MDGLIMLAGFGLAGYLLLLGGLEKLDELLHREDRPTLPEPKRKEVGEE